MNIECEIASSPYGLLATPVTLAPGASAGEASGAMTIVLSLRSTLRELPGLGEQVVRILDDPLVQPQDRLQLFGG